QPGWQLFRKIHDPGGTGGCLHLLEIRARIDEAQIVQKAAVKEVRALAHIGQVFPADCRVQLLKRKAIPVDAAAARLSQTQDGFEDRRLSSTAGSGERYPFTGLDLKAYLLKGFFLGF